MHYKTIVLGLIEEQYPALYEKLRKQRLLLKAIDLYGADLKTRHDYWMDRLNAKKPDSDTLLIASEALELAIQDLRDSLPSESPSSGTETEAFSLDEAMEFVRRHTPSA
jgi:hypothetical protein